MFKSIIKNKKNITNAELSIGNIIPGILDNIIINENAITLSLRFYYLQINIHNKNFSNIIINHNPINKMEYLQCTYDLVQLENDNCEESKKLCNSIIDVNKINIEYPYYNEFVTFLNINNTTKRNFIKHFFNIERTCKTTHLLIIPEVLVSLITKPIFSSCFITQIEKINDNHFILNVSNDKYFKLQHLLFLEENGIYYYVDKINFKNKNGTDIIIIGESTNKIKVEYNELINSLTFLFIKICVCKIENENITNKKIIEGIYFNFSDILDALDNYLVNLYSFKKPNKGKHLKQTQNFSVLLLNNQEEITENLIKWDFLCIQASTN